jgi:hypothetical protein
MTNHRLARFACSIAAVATLAACSADVASSGSSPTVTGSSVPSPSGSTLESSPPSAVETPVPTLVSLKVLLFGGRQKPMEVVINDRSGSVIDAREATPEEIEKASLLTEDLDVSNLDGDRELILVAWIGSVCDTSGSIDIEPGIGSIIVREDPRKACDAVPFARGAVITLASPIDVGGTTTQFQPAEILE